MNCDRLWESIQELGRIGVQSDGSITRFPFTKEEKQAEEWIAARMAEAGLLIERDAVGNLYGVRLGKEPDLPCIVCGSHYDTVKNGGKFDGCLGILAGLEALRVMEEQGIRLNRTIRLAAFKDEEGNRFGCGMIGSKSAAGTAEIEELESADEDGVTLAEAMREWGWEPDRMQSCKLDGVKTYLELHIEQGSILENAKRRIGVVEGIAGLSRYTVRLRGKGGHAGAVPMEDRRDAMVAAAQWILSVTERVSQRKHCVATIGRVQAIPGVCNVICEEAVLSLDLRAAGGEDIRLVLQEIEELNRELESDRGISIEMVKELEIAPCPCSERLKRQIETICGEQGISHQRLMSGAGHDCMNFKDVCETAMIFVPSAGGISHRKEEYTSPEDCAAGAEGLYRLLLSEGE